MYTYSNCLDHADFGAIITANATAPTANTLIIGGDMIRRQPTCEHRPNMPECALDSTVDYYKGWTLFLVNFETCTSAINTQFVVIGYDDH